MWLHLPLLCMWQTLLINHMTFPPKVQFSSVTQSRPTLCNPMNRSTPGLPVHHQLVEFTQTHVHRDGDAIQPSYPLSSPSPRWTQILDTVLLAVATNGLVVSCQATPLCHASDFRDRKTEDQTGKIIHLRSYVASWYLD